MPFSFYDNNTSANVACVGRFAIPTPLIIFINEYNPIKPLTEINDKTHTLPYLPIHNFYLFWSTGSKRE